jgi:hypothetical protein
MDWLGIVIAVLAVALVAGVFAAWFIRRKKGGASCGCDCTGKSRGGCTGCALNGKTKADSADGDK